MTGAAEECAVARCGNNDQVQLWQFLLELLTSAEYFDVIRWHGNMRNLIALMFLIAMALAYNDIDDANYVKLLKDKALQKEFFSCLADVKPCDDFGNHVKVHVEEFMKDACRECDASQKHNGHLLIQTLKRDFPELYVLFEAKYDPDLKLLPTLDNAIKTF